MKQKPYQIIGSEFLAAKKNAILADEMGLGKTNQAVCALDLLSLRGEPINKVLIMCPAVVRPQWQASLRQWLLFHCPHPIQQVEHRDEAITGKTIIVSYSLINEPHIHNQLILKPGGIDVSIMDEFHYLKNVDAQRTVNILGKYGLIVHSKHNWFLSGTPVTARPADLFSILVTIARKRLHPFTNWLGYIKHFCDAYKDQYGYWKHHGSSNLDQLAGILQSVMLRRLAVDVEPDLGKPIIHEVILRLPDKVYDQYEIACEEIKMSGDYVPSQKRVILAGMKGGVIHEHLEVIGKSTNKIVVFYHHKAIGRYLKTRSLRKTFMIDGSTSTKNRYAIRDEFVKAKHATLFAQSQAAGTGFDGLQYGASTCYFAEMPWNPDQRDQNIKRLLRPGQKGKVKVIVPIIQDTIDEKIYAGLFRKQKIINAILN